MTSGDELRAIQEGTRPLTAFNARTMPVRQVVESFVPHDAFARLRRPVNTLLSGPRGSGKTTLMKMLQPIALDLWDADIAQQVRDEIEYTGVFIPTDRMWKRQLEPNTRLANPFGPELKVLANGAFTMHVLRELIFAMQYELASRDRTRRWRRTDISVEGVHRLVGNIAKLAKLETVEPTMDGIADALSIRLADLQGLQAALRDGRIFPFPPWIQVDCLAMAEATIDMFNRATESAHHQWALLFDEMELAPTSIVTGLLDAMRGQPANILLKLSLSPVQPELSMLHLPFAGVHGQDFELIQLNYARQKDALKFGTDLLHSQLLREGMVGRDSRSLLGRSLFSSGDDGSGGQDRDDRSSGRRNPYAVNSKLWKTYQRLAQTDPSFEEWLAKKNIQLHNLEALSSVERASKLRKVRNLVVVREFYRNSDHGRRSRKSYELYSGMDTIIAFCDGNARLLTALIGQLLGADKRIGGRQLPAAGQSTAVDSIVRRFFALIYATEAVRTPTGSIETLADLVTHVGEALAIDVVERPFRDNVPLTFVVDSAVSRSTIELLHLGINVGAFVHIPKRPDYRVPLDLQGEQFRLTYVLAPYFGLPVRLGPSVRLSSILARRRRSASTRGGMKLGAQFGQSSLFDSTEFGSQ